MAVKHNYIEYADGKNYLQFVQGRKQKKRFVGKFEILYT